MPFPRSNAYPHGCQDDSASGPTQHKPSQRLLSQILPIQASTFQLADTYPTSAPTAAPSSSTTTARHASPAARSLNVTPHKSNLRLSHPPPAPSLSHLQQITPQSKRLRLDYDDSRSATTTTSPPSQNSSALNESSAPTGPLSSPSSSNVRPLSGISRPLRVPPASSPSQHSPRFSSHNGPLIPMPQRSIEDFEKLFLQRQSGAAQLPRPNVPLRTLLQAVPPQPPLPMPARNSPVPRDFTPLPPANETLRARRGWSLTGFRSFDLDLERIAEVVNLENTRAASPEEPRLADDRPVADDATDQTSRTGPRIKPSHLGPSDRGLPSGSVLEVLGPPGSGKSSLILQLAITERLRALRRAREALMVHSDEADESIESGNGLDNVGSRPTTVFTDSCYFSEEFWDAEVATADQVLAVDCEGALTPEKIADAAWAAVITLWTSTKDREPGIGGIGQPNARTVGIASSESPVRHQWASMPEEVRRLVAAVLSGIHVSRVTSFAGLIALLHSLRPTDELQGGQSRNALPSAMPPRVSLILVDSLSYHIRSAGGSSQDRKTVAQVTERVREMLLRLQKPFEYQPQSELSAEEQEAARQRSRQTAAKLCIPTVVFTNQLGIRRIRNELDASGSRPAAGMSSGRKSQRNSMRGEASSMLAPLLNGQRPPQPARLRDERPAPSVALCGPQMWEGEDQATMAASPRRLQDLSGRSSPARNMAHDRGWPPSFLGQDVWRILLFRHGTFGHRYAQMVSVPPAVQSELSSLWAQIRERVNVRARAAASNNDAEHRAQPAEAAQTPFQETPDAPQGALQQKERMTATFNKHAEDEKDKQMLELLSQLRASLFRWRPFHITSHGLVS
ncbi:uncharacterized protein UTRI_02832_B [Ustilago trichophora]|uniref:Uncharacterized protein n=1 Tax=Ustilago trichophora TaxID=86804 RepID=A0A5C3E4P5_9BASI|nr:uncharacterized protein UTRI_02832_B [Ustilago trichophora]